MGLIADVILIASVLAAAFYCQNLGRKLKRFNNLENGMGGAVAVLSAQVDDLNKSIESAQQIAKDSDMELIRVTERAEDVRRQLELQIASVHDLVPETNAASDNLTVSTNETVTDQPIFTRHRAAG